MDNSRLSFVASFSTSTRQRLTDSTCLSYCAHALLQLLHPLQSSGFGLGVLEQRPDVEDVVEVRLNLNLEPVALCVLQPLGRRAERRVNTQTGLSLITSPRVIGLERYLQVLVQVQLGEVVLQMDSEVHVLHRVHHDVNELHAGHLNNNNHFLLLLVFISLECVCRYHF